MAKKKDEKDVLVVRDEKTGEISVVAGLNADGSPKRIPAKAENAQSFLQFDRHGDVLDNFFKNFFRQCKEPSRFGFYRVAADQADKLLEVIKDLLKDPDGNKELLAPHKVDTSGYEKKVQEEQSAEKQEQPEQKQDDEPKKQEEMEQKNEQNQESPQQTQGNRGYQPIDESKINWQELEEKWGVKRDDLEKSGDLNRMLNYGKSDLVRVSPNFGGEAFELDARLSFKKDGEGNVSLVPHFIRKEQKLDEYKEHKFSDDDRKNLRETGNLGRVVDLVDRETGEIIPSFVSIDRKTNEITDVPTNKVRIPERIGKTEITKQEQDMLRAGLPVRDKLRAQGRQEVRHHPASERGAARRGVRAGNRQVAPYRPDAGNEEHPRTGTGAGYGECRRHEQGATPQHVDERRRQHPPHQQMERRGLHRTAESRLRGWQSREIRERDRQAGLPRHDVHQVQPGEGTPVPLRHQPRQRAEGRPFQREPHAGGGEQRGQDQRGYQEPERAVAEGTDRPEGHRTATAAEKKQQGHEDVIPCPPLNPK